MGNKISEEQRDQALSDAAEEGRAAEVGNLLKEGANPNRRLSQGGRKSRTSLHQAAKTKNNVDVLTKLLGYVKDVDATDEDGNTALHLAAGYYNNVGVVQTLLHAGPNCKIQNSKGQTALHSAVKGGSDLKIIEALLLADSDPNIADFEGDTALHLCAAFRGVDPMIPGILLRFGGNPNLKNEKGETALHVASRSGNKSVLLLLKFHAKVRLRDKEGRKPSDVAATEEIRGILLWEEKQLEERTIRSESTQQYMTSRASSRLSMFSEGGNSFYGSNPFNNYNTDVDGFNRSDFNKQWKGSGGDGVIHLPNDSDIVIPPQSVPYGTKLEVQITPTNNTDQTPELDLEMFNFDFDISVELPGVLFCAPWMLDSSGLNSPSFSVNSATSPAFSGMCLEGRNKWKCLRELASRPNGIMALRFKLSREKSRPITYKPPKPKRISSTEIELERVPRTMGVNHGSDAGSRSSSGTEEELMMHEDSPLEEKEEDSAFRYEEENAASRSETSSTISGSQGSVIHEDLPLDDVKMVKDDLIEDLNQVVDNDSNQGYGYKQTENNNTKEVLKEDLEYEPGKENEGRGLGFEQDYGHKDAGNDYGTKGVEEVEVGYYKNEDKDLFQEDIRGSNHHDKEEEEHLDAIREVGAPSGDFQEDDLYAKLNQLPVSEDYGGENYEIEDRSSPDRYDRHPIDPALATINEESQSEASDRVPSGIVEFYDHGMEEGYDRDQPESDSYEPRYSVEYDGAMKLNSGPESKLGSTYESGFDITMEDLDNFKQASEKERNGQVGNGGKLSLFD